MSRGLAALTVASLAAVVVGCAVKAPANRTPSTPGASLWERPANLQSRDLLNGPWGADNAPDPNAVYTFVEFKHSGVNPGMTVVDPEGREWSVKQPTPGGLDNEARVEVTLSRLLSAIGYHQPPVYFLRTFTVKDDFGTRVEAGGRFRVKHDSLNDTGAWSWQENPFVGTQAYDGLLAVLMLFNNTDLKNSNNTLYEHRRGDSIEQWYVVRDLGAALGDTSRFAPLKDDPAAFERSRFVVGVTNGYVDFANRGLYRRLVEHRITPDELMWAVNLLGQLTDRQWRDAFRAGGYTENEASQFIRAIRARMDQARALDRRAAADR